jgi:hypothetical protein
MRLPEPGSPAGIVLHIVYLAVVVWVIGVMVGAWN